MTTGGVRTVATEHLGRRDAPETLSFPVTFSAKALDDVVSPIPPPPLRAPYPTPLSQLKQ